MNCKRIKTLLNSYLDGELDSSLRKEMEAHVRKCSACKRELEELRKVISRVKDLPDIEVPEGFYSKVQQRILKTSPKPERRFFGVSLQMAATAAVIVLAVVIVKNFLPEGERLTLKSIGPVEESVERIESEHLKIEGKKRFAGETPQPGDNFRRLERKDKETAAKPTVPELGYDLRNGELKAAEEIPEVVKDQKTPVASRKSDEEEKKEAYAEEDRLEDIVIGEIDQDIDAVTAKDEELKAKTEIHSLAEEPLSELQPTGKRTTSGGWTLGVIRENLPQWKGTYSTYTQGAQLVVREEEAWIELWRRIALTRTPPAIDFSQYMIVGVCLGEKPSGGYQAEITEVEDKTDHVLVSYREITPPEGAVVTQAVTQPYHFKMIKRSPLKVKFQKVE